MWMCIRCTIIAPIGGKGIGETASSWSLLTPPSVTDPPRPPHRTPRFRTGVHSVPNDCDPVDEHIPHTGRQLVGVLVGGVIDHRGRIEDDQVCVHPFADQAPV